MLTDHSDRNDHTGPGTSDTEHETTGGQLFLRSDLDADPTHITLQVRSERLTRRLERIRQALDHLPLLVHRKRTEDIRADLLNALRSAEDLILTTRAVAAETCLAVAATDSRRLCGPGTERLRVIIQYPDRTPDEYGQPGCPYHVAEQLTHLQITAGATILLDGLERACRDALRHTLSALSDAQDIPDRLASSTARHALLPAD
ncbi:hypothetical protein ABZ464_24880 [Streptomyces sp. NPDC005820]|uniref:hypothetical protein n=1 Tax=Streptomyces sp. NPDC005820 TaxID=3157069 RepID=UPI0033C9C959